MKLDRRSAGFFATVQLLFVLCLAYQHLLAILPKENLLGTQSLLLDYRLRPHILRIPQLTPLCLP